MLRSLIHHRRISALVVAGAAVASVVLTGALLVGDSVRGSLRDLALGRLGRIDRALVAARFFREDLAGSFGEAAPAILLEASAIHADTRARAAGIAVLGVDDRFAALFPGAAEIPFGPEAPGFPPVVLNESLASELGAGPGDPILLALPRPGEVPRDSLLGRRDPEDVLETQRAVVAAVIPDRGPGRFGLTLHQSFPRNAYLRLSDLQRALGEGGQANAVLLAPDVEGDAPDLRELLGVDDLGLSFIEGNDTISVESREFVLRPRIAAAILDAAASLGLPARPIQTYLVNEIRIGDRMVPYSTITAVEIRPDDPTAALRLADGGPAPTLGDDDLLLNEWTADDLGAQVGDRVALRYYVVGPRDELVVEERELTLVGIVPFWGLAADPNLTPDYPGIGDAADMSSWDPPFPVDLDLVRPRDERYWDDHRATPKGFVSESAGRRMWRNRYGTVTAVRVGRGGAPDGAQLRRRLVAAIGERLDPAWFGYRVLPLREHGLRASAGATDFSQLFLAFSMFLIVSAAMLTGLLFRLGVERRATEVGLLRAVGFPARMVRLRFLAEGAVLAAAGGLAGVAGGAGYAWLMMLALRTVWLPAVGTPLLFLHVGPMSLAIGWAATVAVVVLSVAAALRRLGQVPAASLLAGSMSGGGARHATGRFGRAVAYGGLALGVAAVAFAWWGGHASSPGLAFGIGAALVISGLGFFSAWCRRPRRGAGGRGPSGLAWMAARNTAWVPGRSLLAVALVGSASFIIVLVASQQHDPAGEENTRDTGRGGYDLVAETDVAVHQDLNGADGRFDLGFSRADAESLEGAQVVPFRVLPGEDASCLNLFRPERPRVLGVPPEQRERGGFTFAGTASETDDPWSLLEQEMEPGVIPAFADANSATWILRLGLGDDVILEDEDGRELRLRLVGLLHRSLFQSELLISEESFLRHFPSRSGYRYFLVDTTDDGADAASLALESVLEPFGFDAVRTEERLAGFLVVENTYLATFQTLGGLGLLLGTLGLGIVLARNILERRGELATMRAIGFRARRLAWMVLAENTFLLLLGVSLGGLAALAAVAPRMLATGATLPWSSLALTLASVLLAGTISSLVAIRTSLRTPLLPALKTDR